MKFIQKDIDKRLLIFIILLIIILTSFIIYHGVAVNKLVNRYNKYEDIFGGLTADAVVEEFNKTSSIKETQNIKIKREEVKTESQSPTAMILAIMFIFLVLILLIVKKII